MWVRVPRGPQPPGQRLVLPLLIVERRPSGTNEGTNASRRLRVRGGRRGGDAASGIGDVEQFRQQPSKFSVAVLPEDPRHLPLDALDRLTPGRYGVAAALGEHDQFRPAVVWVGTTEDVAHVHELVDKFPHGLRRHAGLACELGEPRAVGGDLGEDGGVLGLLWIAGTDHALDDLEAEQAVGLAQHRDRVHSLRH